MKSSSRMFGLVSLSATALFAMVATSLGDFGELRFKLAPGAPDYDPLQTVDFGGDLGLSGNLLIAGAEDDGTFAAEAGSAWVYNIETGSRMFWFDTEDPLQMSDALGESVAISSAGYAAAGADGRQSKTGVVYVFDTNTGQQLHALMADDAGENQEFGQSAAFDGSTLAIGAEDANGGIGKIYLFNAATGEQLRTMTVEDTEIEEIGETIDFRDGLIVSGSNNDAAFLFNANTGDLLHKLTVEGGADGLGTSVAVNGNLVAVGADNVDDKRGAVYLYDASTGEMIKKVQAPDGEADHEFGKSVSLDGTSMLVGAPDIGAVYMFDIVSGHLLRKWESPSSEDIGYGDMVKISGDNAVFGAPSDATLYDDLESFTGAAYVFDVGLADLADVDNDGATTAADLDAIAAAIRNGTTDASVDMNGDGTTDATDHLIWVEALNHTFLGDSNLDGEFNSSDLVTIFRAAEYEDDVDGNSTWAEGDWNGDGDFNTSDLVAAFASGGFEQGPRGGPAVATVPEPCGIAGPLAVLVLGTLIGRCRRMT